VPKLISRPIGGNIAQSGHPGSEGLKKRIIFKIIFLIFDGNEISYCNEINH
jgi:hypothetical protein